MQSEAERNTRIFGEIKKKLFWSFCSEEKRIDKLRQEGAIIGTGCSIESNVHFGSEPYLIQIGDHVRLTSGVQLVTHDGSLWVLRNLGWMPNADRFGSIRIGNNVNIGNNAVIMPGVEIGDHCIIGLGSIVTKSIPARSVAVGVPARVISTLEEYCEKIKDKCEPTKNMTPEEKRRHLKARNYF